MANSTLTRSLAAFPRTLESILPWLRREVVGARLPWIPFVTFVTNESVSGQQSITGTSYADLTELSIAVKLAVPMEMLVLVGPNVEAKTVTAGESLQGVVEVDAGVIGEALPVQYGPRLVKVAAGEIVPVIWAAQFTLDHGVEATIKARASVSGTGADSYDILGDGKSWMALLGVPRSN